VDLYKGKLQAAYGHWLQYVEMLNTIKSGTDAKLVEKEKGMGRLGLARIALFRGDTNSARENLNQVAGIRDEYMAEVGKYYARIGDLQKADELLANLRARMAKRETNYANRALIELLEGEIQLKRGRADRALKVLSDAAKYPWRYLYLQVHDSLASAALAAGRPDIARESYNSLREKRGFAFQSERPDAWILSHYGLAESSRDGALSYYLQFNQLWNDADLDIPSVVQARKMISELSR
jgi:tetratricopeptide (TPR) repeat protein